MRSFIALLGSLACAYVEYLLAVNFMIHDGTMSGLSAVVLMILFMDIMLFWTTWEFWPELNKNRRIKITVYNIIFAIGAPIGVIFMDVVANFISEFWTLFLTFMLCSITIICTIVYLDKRYPDIEEPNAEDNMGEGI